MLTDAQKEQIADEVFQALVRKAKGYREGDKWYPPDTAAANLILKNTCTWWANDPQTLELKKREQNLKERKADNEDW